MREFDILIYGASGFTGRQAVVYLAEHTPPALRIAIAGRSREKLEAICRSIPRNIGVVIADSEKPETVETMVSRTRVVVNTAGPFAKYGEPVVAACVKFGTHYADITGETPWVHRLIARYHQAAAEQGIRLIPCSGFDSVPADLGTWMMVDAVRTRWNVEVSQVLALCKIAGGLNGGTLASVLNMAEGGEMKLLQNPRLLDVPGIDLPIDHQHPRMRWNESYQTWTAPFFMTRVNAAVVRRSAGLLAADGLGYGKQFIYQEAWASKSPWAAAGMWLGVALSEQMLKSKTIYRYVSRLGPASGEGPSEKAMEKGFFEYRFLATAVDGRELRGHFRDQGDPGNRATIKMLCETGLALASNEELPGGSSKGGVLTPATGVGDVLLRRLKAAGMDIAVEG